MRRPRVSNFRPNVYNELCASTRPFVVEQNKRLKAAGLLLLLLLPFKVSM